MSINKFLNNNRLTCNIYGNNGELLVGVGTPLTKNIKKRLENRVWYIDKPSEYIYDNITLDDEDILPLFNDNMVNSSAIINKAKEIVELVKNNPIVFYSMNQIKIYDRYTYEHCNYVACLAVAMGIKLKQNSHQLINIAIAALTHDIGKCMIDHNIINKPDRLTEEEYEIIKKHPVIGYEIIRKNIDIDPIVADTILYHHENFDGTGYPFGLKDIQIPTPASIIHICDVYHALISERSYKDKVDRLDSVDILKNGRGTMFNPNILDVFCKSIQIYKVGSVVELENGKKIIITGFKKNENGQVEEILFTDYIKEDSIEKRIIYEKKAI